ncbi:hypothetical protein OCHUTO_0811 [Orientia chuto str. Dubai]|uniref:Uncharacterized protein n=1 Tax=Orientia chuto str. Dubai TaxID=1359168 RepID=A0A0F3MJ53_9RICK|nr:hypothetical protein [Candidatus Orientia mediorientalis]KJV55512.1 hypothetical protein OCHUTO_0811 [Orientia chuto str. Dubai]
MSPNNNLDHVVQSSMSHIKAKLPPLTSEQREKMKAFEKQYLDLFKPKGQRMRVSWKVQFMRWLQTLIDFFRECIKGNDKYNGDEYLKEYDIQAFARGVEKALNEGRK